MNNELGKSVAEVFRERYVIPLYQRNFAWRTDEVQQLLQDVYDSFKENPEGDYYVGSLVVLKRHNGDYEVIDGQQRLSVVSLIAILMKRLPTPVLFYDSRPEVQQFFAKLCKSVEEALCIDDASLFYLREACAHILKAKVDVSAREGSRLFLTMDGIADYFMNHVIFIKNDIPADTDVAAYFEIMNNRGEQLQKHELIKAGMMERLRLADGKSYDVEKQRQFAVVWDACAQMDVPIQRNFPSSLRRSYFGEGYDEFAFRECETGKFEEKREYSIAEIIGTEKDKLRTGSVQGSINTEDECDISEYRSILDFPNFLMHVFRLYLQTSNNFTADEIDVSLNEKELLPVYRRYGDHVNPMRFVGLLLFCRTVYDRYIVKTATDAADADDGRKWVLVKPCKYDKGWKYVNSFPDKNEDRIIKAVSMLQVTFRTRIYKNWLFESLLWFWQRSCASGDLAEVDLTKITYREYLSFLHDYMLKYYADQRYDITEVGENQCPTRENSYSRGTDTPHFLLNFIDYLYYCKACDSIKPFDFKYWNSVEHHLAQNKGGLCPYLDNLGNLCLVSKSANSRLSDRDVKEKVEAYGTGNLGPNRQIMYNETRQSLWRWGESEIRNHYNEIVKLLSEREELLKVAEV